MWDPVLKDLVMSGEIWSYDISLRHYVIVACYLTTHFLNPAAIKLALTKSEREVTINVPLV